jgi:hypothetical protein
VEYRSQSGYLAGLLRGYGLCRSRHWTCCRQLYHPEPSGLAMDHVDYYDRRL